MKSEENIDQEYGMSQSVRVITKEECCSSEEGVKVNDMQRGARV